MKVSWDKTEEAHMKRLQVLELLGIEYKMFIIFKKIRDWRYKGQEAINKSLTIFGKKPNKVLQIEINRVNRLNRAKKRISELEDWSNYQEGIFESLRDNMKGRWRYNENKKEFQHRLTGIPEGGEDSSFFQTDERYQSTDWEVQYALSV